MGYESHAWRTDGKRTGFVSPNGYEADVYKTEIYLRNTNLPADRTNPNGGYYDQIVATMHDGTVHFGDLYVRATKETINDIPVIFVVSWVFDHEQGCGPMKAFGCAEWGAYVPYLDEHPDEADDNYALMTDIQNYNATVNTFNDRLSQLLISWYEKDDVLMPYPIELTHIKIG